MSRTRVITRDRSRIALARLIAVAFLAAAAAVLVSSASVGAAAMEPITPTPSGGGAVVAWAALLAGALAWSAVLEVRYQRRTR